MVITHTLQQKRSNKTADWWPFSTTGMSTFLLLKTAMKKCLFGPELRDLSEISRGGGGVETEGGSQLFETAEKGGVMKNGLLKGRGS